jgi:hypothetical protein
MGLPHGHGRGISEGPPVKDSGRPYGASGLLTARQTEVRHGEVARAALLHLWGAHR